MSATTEKYRAPILPVASVVELFKDLRHMSKFVWGMWLLLAVAPAAADAADNLDGQWQFGSSPSFSSGKYGTDSRTEVVYTPITARRLFENGDVTLVFPFTCISGSGGVTVVDGSPVRNERLGTAGSDARSGRSAASPAAAALPATDCGLGDVVVRGRYYLLDERGWLPTIALRAHVKTPTASAERGLGTGRTDEGVGLEVSRMLAGGVLAMVDGGYTVIGKPADVQYNNNWWYDLLFRDSRPAAVERPAAARPEPPVERPTRPEVPTRPEPPGRPDRPATGR